jgi:hypothetical protein
MIQMMMMMMLMMMLMMMMMMMVMMMMMMRCNLHLARQAAKTDSWTCGPHKGSNPLHLVLAFCRVALSHSSRPRACLKHFELHK